MSCSTPQNWKAISEVSTTASTCSQYSGDNPTIQRKASSKFQALIKCLGPDAARRYHVGSVEEKYEIDGEVLGKGVNGEVVLGWSRVEDAEPVAIKTLEFSELCDSEAWTLLEHELEILSCVDHPHAIGAIDIYESDDRVSIVMPVMGGGNLDHLQFREIDAVHAGRQMLESLTYLHDCNIIHRDVKPGNFMVDDSRSTLKIIDYGLATFWKQGEEKLQLRCGTPGFMSPEMVSGKGYTKKTDIWSLGVTMYELLVGEMPFDADSPTPQQSDVDELLASSACADLSDAARHFLGALLTRHPSARPLAEEALRHPWILSEGATEEIASAELKQWEFSLRRQSEEPKKATRRAINWVDLEDDSIEVAAQPIKVVPRRAPRRTIDWADLDDDL